MKTGFHFKTIWVIESLPNGEYRTGKELYDDVLYYKHIQDPNVLVEFVEVTDKSSLKEQLGKILLTLKSTGQIPLIHFETHGNKEGLELKSGDFVLYEDLCQILREINILTQNNLFVIVAACNGAYLSFILKNSLTMPCPFWGICGPSVKINAVDIIAGYSAFYDEAFISANMNAALDRLKQSIPHHANNFNIWNSEYMFVHAFKHYLHDYCNSNAVDQRTKSILQQVQSGLNDTFSAEKIESYVRERLGTENGQRQEFERMKALFFMHNLYPGVSSLPNPSFGEMMKFRLLEKEITQ